MTEPAAYAGTLTAVHLDLISSARGAIMTAPVYPCCECCRPGCRGNHDEPCEHGTEDEETP